MNEHFVIENIMKKAQKQETKKVFNNLLVSLIVQHLKRNNE